MATKSAWEKLTSGMCNAAIADKPKRKQASAKRLKIHAATKARQAKLAEKFKKAGHLLEDDSKAWRRMSDSWQNRSSTNTKGTWNRKNSKPIDC